MHVPKKKLFEKLVLLLVVIAGLDTAAILYLRPSVVRFREGMVVERLSPFHGLCLVSSTRWGTRQQAYDSLQCRM